MNDQTVEITREVLNGEFSKLVASDGRCFDLKNITYIGRAPDNDIVIHDPFVSSYHCQVERRGNGFVVRDLKSKNGIRVNEIQVKEALLDENSKIEIGQLNFQLLPMESNDDQGFFDHDPVLRSKNRYWSLTLRTLATLSRTKLSVFLQGESGTGKEVIARKIHQLSHRRDKPFVSVNCSALTENLVESELFGHVKGSFTGASMDRRGAFEAARGGTLFLDEIGDLPQALQPKLLRALENNEIRPVGSDVIISTDVRIITATHKNLSELVTQGLFRADLYFRVHVVKVIIPPLNERLEDFEDVLNIFCKDFKVRFTVDAVEALKRYPWPGNIRELKNVVSRCSALYPGVPICVEHLANLLDRVTSQAPAQQLKGAQSMPALRDIEKDLIRSRLLANKGNQRRTARELGIPKSTLHDRIKSYGIDVDVFRKKQKPRLPNLSASAGEFIRESEWT